MPFVQRVVQPVHIAQACNFISASGNKTAKFNCIADKCQHKHYANKKQPLNELHHVKDSSVNTRERSTRESIALTAETVSYRVNVKSGVHLEVQANDARTPVTQVIVHANGVETQRISPLDIDITDNSSNAIINNSCSSSCYLNASDATKHNVYSSLFPTPQIPIKKLKEHVEFLSSATSPIRSQHTSFSPSATKDCVSGIGAMSKSRSAAVIVAGHEFDSISNITLSNALRQLASLVLIASDIFADLHKELRIVGERARVVQNKIITVERNVSDYDPKTVTVLHLMLRRSKKLAHTMLTSNKTVKSIDRQMIHSDGFIFTASLFSVGAPLLGFKAKCVATAFNTGKEKERVRKASLRLVIISTKSFSILEINARVTANAKYIFSTLALADEELDLLSSCIYMHI
ncbi:hypothetical protein GQX74_000911 [Glossina fuscipes]|nr:hypothetical protein GQX74_000911 [Glossina fuscipes]